MILEATEAFNMTHMSISQKLQFVGGTSSNGQIFPDLAISQKPVLHF